MRQLESGPGPLAPGPAGGPGHPVTRPSPAAPARRPETTRDVSTRLPPGPRRAAHSLTRRATHGDAPGRWRPGRTGPGPGLTGLSPASGRTRSFRLGRLAASSSPSRVGRDRRRQCQKVERSGISLLASEARSGRGRRLGKKNESKNQKIKKEEDVNVVSAPSSSFDSCQQWIFSLPKFIYGRIIYQVLLTFHVFVIVIKESTFTVRTDQHMMIYRCD